MINNSSLSEGVLFGRSDISRRVEMGQDFDRAAQDLAKRLINYINETNSLKLDPRIKFRLGNWEWPAKDRLEKTFDNFEFPHSDLTAVYTLETDPPSFFKRGNVDDLIIISARDNGASRTKTNLLKHFTGDRRFPDFLTIHPCDNKSRTQHRASIFENGFSNFKIELNVGNRKIVREFSLPENLNIVDPQLCKQLPVGLLLEGMQVAIAQEPAPPEIPVIPQKSSPFDWVKRFVLG